MALSTLRSASLKRLLNEKRCLKSRVTEYPLLVLYTFVSVLHFLNVYFVQQPEPYPIFDSFFSYALSHDVAISALLMASFAFLLVAPAITRALRLGVPREEAHAG